MSSLSLSHPFQPHWSGPLLPLPHWLLYVYFFPILLLFKSLSLIQILQQPHNWSHCPHKCQLLLLSFSQNKVHLFKYRDFQASQALCVLIMCFLCSISAHANHLVKMSQWLPVAYGKGPIFKERKCTLFTFESPALKHLPQQLAPNGCPMTIYWVEINGISRCLMIPINFHNVAMIAFNLKNRFISLGLVSKFCSAFKV